LSVTTYSHFHRARSSRRVHYLHLLGRQYYCATGLLARKPTNEISQMVHELGCYERREYGRKGQGKNWWTWRVLRLRKRSDQSLSLILTIGGWESDWQAILFGKGYPAVKIEPSSSGEIAIDRIASKVCFAMGWWVANRVLNPTWYPLWILCLAGPKHHESNN